MFVPGFTWGYRGTSLTNNRAPLGPYSMLYGGPRRGGSVSYERGSPVAPVIEKDEEGGVGRGGKGGAGGVQGYLAPKKPHPPRTLP